MPNEIVTKWSEKKTFTSIEELVMVRKSIKVFLSHLKDEIAKGTDKERLYQMIDGFLE